MLLSRREFLGVAFLGSTAKSVWAKQYVAPRHHEFHEWYQEIQAKLGISGCCDINSQDCGPVADYIDRGGAGNIEVLLEDNNWYNTRNARVYYVKTPDNGGHACRKPRTGEYGQEIGGFVFFCVFLPDPFRAV